MKPPHAETHRDSLDFALPVDQMPQRSGGRIVFEADVAQERQRRIRRNPHLAAQCCEGSLPHGELELVRGLDLQVPQQLHLQIIAEHLPHERGRHRVLGLGEVNEIGVAAIRRQLPRRVVAADAPHQRLAGAQLDEQKFPKTRQPAFLMRHDDLDFQLVRQGREALQ